MYVLPRRLQARVQGVDRLNALVERGRAAILAVLTLAALAAGAVPVEAAAGANADPFDLRTTDWRMAHWRTLSERERAWLVVGFVLGWRGEHAPAGARPPDPPAVGRRVARLDAAVSRMGPEGSLGVALVRLLSTAPPWALRGDDWMVLAPRQKLAVLHGVYAGIYAREIVALLGADATDADLARAFARACRLVRPRLALAPALLFARLSDWYFYTDRRRATLMSTIATIVNQIKGP